MTATNRSLEGLNFTAAAEYPVDRLGNPNPKYIPGLHDLVDRSWCPPPFWNEDAPAIPYPNEYEPEPENRSGFGFNETEFTECVDEGEMPTDCISRQVLNVDMEKDCGPPNPYDGGPGDLGSDLLLRPPGC